MQRRTKTMNKILISICFLASLSLQAQQFVGGGIIEFEFKVSMHKLMKEQSPEWYEKMKDKTPKFDIHYNNLLFNDSQSLFTEGREPDVKTRSFWYGTSNENYIYNDFNKHTYTASKQVYEETFLLNDSTRKIVWKLTNDTRNIAGYECKKAVGWMFDTVYIVAFYTDKIICPGGPESITGLPGMILGAAIPRIYSTWFATKVDLTPVKEGSIRIPTKGKKISFKELQIKLTETFKDWGKGSMVLRSLI
ncbi:MAG: GLPGLI family protein [Flavobacteriaceae bacterium]|nr:GLPGLI family protein [Flavobacteriaceae bacterium]